MNPYQYITKNPERSIQILGISFEQFKALSGAAISQEAEQRVAQEAEKRRINKKGAGSPKILTQEAENCLTIYNFKHAPTYEMLGMQFDISRTTANTIFHTWAKIIRNLLAASLMEECIDDDAINK